MPSANTLRPSTRAGRVLLRLGRQALYLLGSRRPGIVYVTDSFNWSLHEDGRALQQYVRDATRIAYDITDDGRGHYGKVVHFGSQFFLNQRLHLRKHRSCRLVFSWFHGEPDDPDPDIQDCYRQLVDAEGSVDRIVTSCTTALRHLTTHRWPEAKISFIPLGVDLDRYRLRTDAERTQRRLELGIPPDAFVVGSFQKDGVGWGNGDEPKRIKGPDVLLDVMARVAKQRRDLFVLLLGPARGFVKAGLARLGVAYRHVYLEDERDVARHYDALDCYLIASRSEGGPKSLMESMAKGVPVVSTRMGMPADVLADGQAGLLAENEDAAGLSQHVLRVAEEPDLRARLTACARDRVREFHWPAIARRYLEEVYRPLLATLE